MAKSVDGMTIFPVEFDFQNDGKTPLCATFCAPVRRISPLDSLQRPCTGACSQVRNFLHTTAQEVAHFLPENAMKHLETCTLQRFKPVFSGIPANLARSLITVGHPPGDFASRAP